MMVTSSADLSISEICARRRSLWTSRESDSRALAYDCFNSTSRLPSVVSYSFEGTTERAGRMASETANRVRRDRRMGLDRIVKVIKSQILSRHKP